MNRNKKTDTRTGQGSIWRRSSIRMIIAMTFLAGVIIFSAAGVAAGRGKSAEPENAAYYRQVEKAYVSQARSVMESEGFKNSGITMTHLVDEAGACTYVVKLHHARLAGSTQEKKRAVYEALETIDFADGEVLYEFI